MLLRADVSRRGARSSRHITQAPSPRRAATVLEVPTQLPRAAHDPSNEDKQDMNTTASHPAPQGSGCSPIIAVMGALLAFVVGGIAGGGALYGYFSTKPVESTGPTSVEPAECPPCEQATGAASTYALVYPIEETLQIEGNLEKDVLRERVIKNRFKLQKCYQGELDADASVKGEMSLQLSISASTGDVAVAVPRQNTTGSKALAKCVLDEMKSWNFKEDVSGKSLIVVKFDVLFTPIGSGANP